MKKLLLALSLMSAFSLMAQFVPQQPLQLQGTQYAAIMDMEVDHTGNIYSVGYADPNTDLDPGPGTVSSGSVAVTFVSKYNPTAQSLSWITTYTTNGSFTALKGIALNAGGDVFVTGLINTDMDLDPGPAMVHTTSYQASVIIKFTNAGNYSGFKEIVSANGGGKSITVDQNSGNVYIAGFADGNPNFDPGVTNYTVAAQSTDLYLASYSPSLAFNWAKLIGSGGGESPNGIDQLQTDQSGNVYAAAKLNGSTTIAGTALSTNSECIIRTTAAGSVSACWSFPITAPYGNKNLKFNVCKNGKFYIAGGFYGTVDFDPTGGTLNKVAYAGTASDEFVGFYNANGTPNWLHVFSNYIAELYTSCTSDNQKNVYVWGNYDHGSDFDPGPGTATFPQVPSPQSVLLCYDSLGNYKHGKTFMNGTDLNAISKTIIAPAQNRLLFMGTSFYSSVDYAPGTPTMTFAVSPSGSGYITRYDFCTGSSQTVSPLICNGASYTLPSGTVVTAASTYTTHLESYWGCDSTIYTALGFHPATILNVAPANAGLCEGASLSLLAGGANTYTWSTGASTQTISISPASTTVYTLSGTDANGCSASVTKTVVVNPLPVLNTASSNTASCAGQPATLSASGADTYAWSTGATGHSITVNPGTSTSYTVTGTNSQGCSNTDVLLLTVNALPPVNAVSSASVLCAGQSSTLNATGATSYTWSNGSNNPSIVISPSVTISYTVSGKDNNGCIGTASVSLLVSTCTGVDDADSPEHIQVYPNPFSDHIRIKGIQTHLPVKIIDAVGRTVYEGNPEDGLMINGLEDLAAGLYYLVISTPDNRGYYKLIKE